MIDVVWFDWLLLTAWLSKSYSSPWRNLQAENNLQIWCQVVTTRQGFKLKCLHRLADVLN